MPQAAEFNAIRISLASPEQIRQWSYGEVTKPETINYRTLRPEKDGLFCERIFGPTKDWECYCGKYKKVRYKGVICDRCGVEVTRAKVRRERMGHITLAAPVAHIWFAKGTPSRLGLLLDLSPRNLERVLYFAQYIITSVNEEARQRAVSALKDAYAQEQEKVEREAQESILRLKGQPAEGGATPERDDSKLEEEVTRLQERAEKLKSDLENELQAKMDELDNLRPLQLLTEARCRELRERFGEVFTAAMGAEAILNVLHNVNLEEMSLDLQNEVRTTSGQRRKKAIKRLRAAESFRKSGNKPEWMILTMLPVLPPDLRPMVQLDGGRFATSDLNDLYRRVINRNNRLRRLLELGAPEIIVRNEKRMLQEAVDALIDNGRRGRPIAGSHNHKLKSLSDLLRGKQGRFRQNLLGKRVDYSGRSVIVVGPTLELGQCGLPKRMALELFKPFVMNRLVILGHAHNIRSAKRTVERVRPEVWDILEEVIQTRPVLLNRAPTLHRLGIQAFQPILVEGSAIQIHPLVCTAFNADFDGDQMAVHVPLSREAVREARKIMLSTFNMLSPSSGEPIIAPTLDMVLGCYYLTTLKPGAPGEGLRFRTFEEARMAYDQAETYERDPSRRFLDLRAAIQVKDPANPERWISTTMGRIIFNDVLPQEVRRYEQLMDKNTIKTVVADCYRLLGNQGTAQVLDRIKTLGFRYATRAGITIGINDVEVPLEKHALVKKATEDVDKLDQQWEMGLITEGERYQRAVQIWQKVSERMDSVIATHLPSYGGIYMMAISGAKGNLAQVKQMAGMRGLMSNPRGEIIDLPIKSSFREGLSVLEYFISTHGARKGLADTALRTADSGYLTRRLVDVAQEVIVLSEDCGTEKGAWVYEEKSDPDEDVSIASFYERIVGFVAAAPVAHPQTGEILVDRGQEVDEPLARKIVEAGLKAVYLRSPLACEALRGVCQRCYGRSLATGRLVMMGEAVGIIAAQSIGEPGTQLTMRTFHTGGVAGRDITSGLPRVEELFEARIPKGKARLAEIDGQVVIFDEGEIVGDAASVDAETSAPAHTGRVIRVVNKVPYTDEHPLPPGYAPAVREGEHVEAGALLAAPVAAAAAGEQGGPEGGALAQRSEILARISGKVRMGDGRIEVAWEETDFYDHEVQPTQTLLVKTGEKVRAGQKLTAGVKDPHDLLRIEGREAVERYLMEQVQTVYRNQGVSINNKHIEVIIRQLLRRVRVETPGDTDLLPNQLIDRAALEEVNRKVLAEGGEPARARPEILGVTRASLSTDSVLARASFQETARVLTEAAVRGETDYLLGLKENVIIGRLIPARFDMSEEGRRLLGLSETSVLGTGVTVEAGGEGLTSILAAPTNGQEEPLDEAEETEEIVGQESMEDKEEEVEEEEKA
ncbi:MAG: DNA-directed RNA polymerase subunit beta' [Chloroflexi bacterium]|nr:DNA-directed RNA polymerase subunit beta' [Chloroflexota bacterium]